MKQALRRKVLLAQAPIGLVLALLGLLAVGTLNYLSQQSNAILADNFRSVLALQRIIDSIERVNAAALTLLAGERDHALDQVADSRSAFWRDLNAEESAINLPGEADAVRNLRRDWETLETRFEQLAGLDDAEFARRAYFREFEPSFHAAKSDAELVLGLNQDAMLRKNDAVETIGGRVVVLMALAALAAFLFGTYLSIVLTGRLLAPLSRLSQAVRRIGEGDLEVRADITGNDEIGSLAADFNQMANRLKDYRTSSLGELLQAQLALLSVIDSLDDPILVLGIDSRVSTVNAAAEHLLGLPADLSSGDPMAAADPLVRLAVHDLAAHVLNGKGPVAPKSFAEAMRIERGGAVHYLLPRAAPVYEQGSGIVGATVMFQDVTRLRQFDELKNDMMATVAHEFRTPLTSLRMAVHLCLEEVAGPLTEKQANLLYGAREECERLQNMVDDLLDLSRLESGRAPLSLQPEDIVSAIEPAIDGAEPAATARGITIELDAPPMLDMVMIDRDRLAHVFGNLIDNAVGHSPANDKVVVKIRPKKEPGGLMMYCAIIDHGPGIPGRHHDRLFDKFYRVPGIDHHGAGLGLSIAREIVQAHGGRIGVVSEEGQGASFWFTVPLVPSDQPVPAVAENA